MFNNSLPRALKQVYPEIVAEETIQRGFWKDKRNQKDFLDQIAKEFQIKSPLDWKRVKSKDITDRGGSGFLNYYQRSVTSPRLLFLSKSFPKH